MTTKMVVATARYEVANDRPCIVMLTQIVTAFILTDEESVDFFDA